MQKKKKQNLFIKYFLVIFSFLRNKWYMVLVLFIVIAIALGGKTYSKFSSIKLTDFDGNISTQNWNGKERKTILLIGGDEQSNGYIFVDFLCIFEIEPYSKEIRFFNISPYFLNYTLGDSNNVLPYTLRNSLAFYQSQASEDIIHELILATQNLIGMRIDHYVYLDKKDVEEVLSHMKKIRVESSSSVSDQDLEIELNIIKGSQQISLDQIVSFLASDDDGWDNKMYRQLSFLQTMTQRRMYMDLIFEYDQYIHEFSSRVRSDLNFTSILRLYYYLLYKNKSIKVAFTRKFPSNVIYSESGEAWIPVYEDIDQEIKKIFTKNEVKLEQAKLQVINSTSTSYLAKNRSRWLSNRGIRVSMLGNTSTNHLKNTIYVEDYEAYKNTIREISEVLRSEIELVEEKYPEKTVGDLVLVLGESEIN